MQYFHFAVLLIRLRKRKEAAQKLKLVKKMNQYADKLTFEILTDTIGSEIAVMLRSTIKRD